MERRCCTLARHIHMSESVPPETISIVFPFFGTLCRYVCHSIWLCSYITAPFMIASCHDISRGLPDLQLQLWYRAWRSCKKQISEQFTYQEFFRIAWSKCAYPVSQPDSFLLWMLVCFFIYDVHIQMRRHMTRIEWIDMYSLYWFHILWRKIHQMHIRWILHHVPKSCTNMLWISGRQVIVTERRASCKLEVLVNEESHNRTVGIILSCIPVKQGS